MRSLSDNVRPTWNTIRQLVFPVAICFKFRVVSVVFWFVSFQVRAVSYIFPFGWWLEDKSGVVDFCGVIKPYHATKYRKYKSRQWELFLVTLVLVLTITISACHIDWRLLAKRPKPRFATLWEIPMTRPC